MSFYILQRGECGVHTLAAGLAGMADCVECGRSGASPQEVELCGQSLVSGFRSGCPPGAASSVITDAEKNSRILSGAVRQGFYFHSLWGGDRKESGRFRDSKHPWAWSPGRYILYVSRMEPENNALMVRQAFDTRADGFQAGAGGRCALRRRLHPPGGGHVATAA